MSSSYDVLAAIDMERVAGHPVGGGVAQRGDAVGGAKPGGGSEAGGGSSGGGFAYGGFAPGPQSGHLKSGWPNMLEGTIVFGAMEQLLVNIPNCGSDIWMKFWAARVAAKAKVKRAAWVLSRRE